MLQKVYFICRFIDLWGSVVGGLTNYDNLGPPLLGEQRAAPSDVGTGRIKLSDGAVLKLRILIVDVREAGFSPFGGVNFDVKTVGGVSTLDVPDELKKAVADKPVAPPEPPDGWEIVDIVEQEPAVAEVVVDSSKGRFRVKIVAEAVMVSRNMKYKTIHNEPPYWVSWVLKISWKPVEAQRAQS